LPATAYRIVSNFVFLGLVYAAMHALSGLRSFYFLPARRAPGRRDAATRRGGREGPNAAASRKQIVADVTALRHAGRDQIYIDILLPGAGHPARQSPRS